MQSRIQMRNQFLVGTALPPRVDEYNRPPKGEIVCQLGKVVLNNKKTSKSSRSHAESTDVVIRWWGDAGMGTRMTLAPGSTGSVTFPVCCGPRHLMRYLRDMSSLVVALEDTRSHATVGRCTIDVRFLDMGRPVSGTFPVLLAPRNQPSSDGSAVDPTIVGAMLRHVGTLDVHLEVFYTTADISSFEINEHFAARDSVADRTPLAARMDRKLHQQGGTGPAAAAPKALRQQLEDGEEPLVEPMDLDRFDQALGQIDLFELLMDRLQR